MVFTSVPLYLDSPNWQQQPNHQQGSSSENPQLPSQSQPHPQASGVSPGLIRPGSMADRARMANLPQPEASLKCPRCESTNTKFCYFNNYSLSQPRHFCKTCRRYWTRGGALRSVPVGGGCRRNKRTKNNRSKSPATEENQKGRSSSTSSGPSNNITSDTISPIPAPQLPFMASLRHLTDYGAADMGFNFSGIHSAIAPASGADLDFMMGSNSGVGSSTLLPTGGAEQWRLQQFPFLTGMEQPTGGLYRFEGEGIEPPAYNTGSGQFSSKPSASLKMEENQGLNLTRQFMGNIPGNDQYWDGNAWTDLSGFTSTSNHLL